MPAPVYSTQLVVISSAALGTQALFTARPDHVTVVRDVSIRSPGANATIDLYVSAGSQNATFIHVVATGIQVDHWDGRVVMNPGDILFAATGVAGHQIIISGYELTLV